MSRILPSLLVLSTFGFLMETSADAQSRNRNKNRLAYTNAATAHPDYAWQGEFFGAVFDGKSWQKLGLQVSAIGDGEFAGLEFTGGLPGNGADMKSRVKMTGQLKDGCLLLKGKDRHYLVEGDTALIYRSNGQPLGQIVKVHRVSPTMGQHPPVGAEVLFNGSHAKNFKNGKVTFDGLLKEGTETKKAYRDFTLHIEFRLPFMPYARGQGRGNSGVYLQGRYEVQILDSFTLDGKHNECGGLYKFREPDLNMCLPPLTWQTYDIDFTAAKFKDGKKVGNATLTVWHNGVLIHDNVQLKNKTGAGAKEGPDARATKLQNHSNPVRFRNIWLVDRTQPVLIPSPQVQYAAPSRWKNGNYYPLRRIPGRRLKGHWE
jgi:hypothetical protein